MTYENAAEAAKFITSRYTKSVSTAVVLGSGLGAFAGTLENAVAIPYEEIPNFSRSTVVGHAGQLVLGELNGVPLVIQQGRFHYYEGYSMEEVILPIRAFAQMGIKNVILTNAAGSLSTDMTPGSLMLISDHLNMMGVNPLRGANDERFGQRFPDMTDVYTRQLQELASHEAEKIARERFERGEDDELTDFLHRGIYCALSGPTYETPAEIRMYRLFGADAVGMSTVPEAIAARHMSMRVLGISCITNFGAGMTTDAIDHQEVLDTGQRLSSVFNELLRRIVAKI